MREKQHKSIQGLVMLCLALVLACTLAAPCFALDNVISDDPKILFLLSYNYDWESVPRQLDGVTKAIGGSGNIDYVFMDTKRQSYEAVEQPTYHQVQTYEQEDGPYDYVIAGDDAALTFVMQYRSELFDGVPVIFEGINNEDFAYEAAKDPLVTGVVETFPLEDTLRLAVKVNPAATQVVGISDASLSGIGSTKQFLDCQSSFPSLHFDTINTSAMSEEQVRAAVEGYGSDTILIYLMMSGDNAGNYFSNTEAVEFVCSHAAIPVYKADEIGVGNGIVGGVVVSFEGMASRAAEIVQAMENGASIGDFPVEIAPVYTVFDYAVLQKYKISTKQLPADTLYLNRPVGFFEQNRQLLMPFAVSCLSLVCVLAAFYLSHKRSKKYYLQECAARNSLSATLDNVAAGIYVFEFHGDDFSIIVANRAICEMMGTAREKTIGVSNGNAMQLTHPDDVETLKKVILELKKPDGSVNYEYRSKNLKTGQYAWLAASGRSVAQPDGTVRAYICYTDITEQKRLRALQTTLEAQQKANETKSNFLANMSHEIRTPMNAILGMTRLTADVVEKGSEAEAYIHQIEDASEYLLGILNDMLEMSRIDSGKDTLHKEWVMPHDVVAPVIEMITPMMKAKNITFHYDARLTAPSAFEYNVDPQKTKQMLMNLLNNACKFTPAGGRVSLSFQNIAVNKDKQEAVDRITIEDTGCGMSKEFLQKVFQPFEQERTAANATVPGTGLGLAISRSVARQMGGDISVTSELGKGSVFTVSFPYKYRLLDPKATQISKDTIQNSDEMALVGRRILLAEDHPLNAMIATKLLEKRGMSVTRAEDGAAAVQMFAANAPDTYDAILMDVRMPVMDGLTATKALRALPREDAKTIPIIAMTANAFDEDRRKSLEAGMNSHLAKPIEPELLYRTLAELLPPD